MCVLERERVVFIYFYFTNWEVESKEGEYEYVGWGCLVIVSLIWRNVTEWMGVHGAPVSCMNQAGLSFWSTWSTVHTTQQNYKLNIQYNGSNSPATTTQQPILINWISYFSFHQMNRTNFFRIHLFIYISHSVMTLLVYVLCVILESLIRRNYSWI